ncbi:HlyD family secretion protein [Litoribacter populi]|uniref:HlyD family secretion protein n=1 Tax=Litoribacter populi TaxID=2598460 RepID=UPI00117BFF70|nr:HlyD family efflux transporter periplasmic adaptor subunit [Litoribacter populi]
MKEIFPAAIVKSTTEYYQQKITVRSQVIYLSLVFGLLTLFLMLPIVKVDISVQSPGVFQSALNRNEIIIPMGGRLSAMHVYENKYVQKGDLVATVRSEMIDLEIVGVKERKRMVDGFLHDLRQLVSFDWDADPDIALSAFQSKFYQAAYFEFLTEYANHRSMWEKQKRDFDRAQILYESQTIPFAEYDEALMQYQQVEGRYRLFAKKQIASWQHDLNTYENEYNGLQNKLSLLKEQLEQYKVYAGVSGTVMNVPNLRVGDFMGSNQRLGEISPDSTLLAVTYLNPADIALIEKGQKVIFQVDAFNYNQWGTLEGEVLEVSDDLMTISESNVAFRVICKLEDMTLSLSNGIEGTVKKGMTFNGRFVIAKRSLFQLLFDKVDDWVNPTVK